MSDSVYDRFMIHVCTLPWKELYKTIQSLAWHTPYEQLEELFGEKLNSDEMKKTVETEKVIQEAKNRVTTKLQIELCLKHLVCPECADDLSKAICQTKGKTYWDIYQCKNCSFTAKRSADCQTF